MALIVGTKGSAQIYRGKDRAKRYRGARPSQWIPPAIQFIGSATGIDTAASPAHQAGDVIFVFAYRSASALVPTSPSGFTNINSGAGNQNSHIVAYKVATSAVETIGTWTNAEVLVALVYRGLDQANPVGANAIFTNVADILYPALTLQVADGTAKVLAIHGRRGGSVEQPDPPGVTRRADTGSTAGSRVVAFGSDGVTSWPQLATGGNNGQRYRSVSVEMRAAP